MTCYAKTTGSKGIHVYIPIRRGPVQKEVWGFAKSFALALAAQAPKLVTSEYRVAKRPKSHVLVDYNQNAWGRTLASIYSVRPQPRATVSTPVTWDELERGVAIEDYRIDNGPVRVAKLGDLWKPLLQKPGRIDLELLLCRTPSSPRTRRRSLSPLTPFRQVPNGSKCPSGTVPVVTLGA